MINCFSLPKIFSRLIAFTIFLSSFLLFLVQPLISKFLLPYFGGSSHVWIVSVSFFTSMLFLGYFYVFLLAKIDLKKQFFVHLLFLIILTAYHFFSFTGQNWISPILPSNLSNEGLSVHFILSALFLSIGSLFLILSSTNTLLQNWYSRATDQASPYFLYSVSNAGAILGLFSYPLFFEFFLGNKNQSIIWFILFLLYLLLMFSIIGMAIFISRKTDLTRINKENEKQANESIRLTRIFGWFFYAALPVMFFLTVTDKLSKGIASFPLIWILPLFLYLLSLVITFKVSIRSLSPGIIMFSMFFLTFILSGNWDNNYLLYVVLNSLLIFGVGLVCHGRLYEIRPKNLNWLAAFYLLITFSGAMASLFISLAAPFIFSNYYEFYLIIFLFLITCFKFIYKNNFNFRRSHILFTLSVFLIGMNFVLATSGLHKLAQQKSSRGVFGVLTIEYNYIRNSKLEMYHQIKKLLHGSISHGHEIVAYPNSGKTSYYSSVSGLGVVMEYFQREREEMTTGMIGLGAGMVADYNRNNDKLIFYEIDSNVVNLAQNHFSYLERALGIVEVRLGDARLVIEQEIKNSDEKYDVLTIDAFSDNAIPVHLLTKEAFEIFDKKIADNGAIIYHISNKYLNLAKILHPLCDHFSTNCVLVKNNSEMNYPIYRSNWMIMTRNSDFFDYLHEFSDDRVELYFGGDLERTKQDYWTDDRNNIFPLLSF